MSKPVAAAQRRVGATQRPVAACEPLEIVASDLRRLQALAADPRRSVWVRLTARLAFLDRLREACGQLEVAHRLDELRGLHRRFEVERCRRELSRRGLAL